MIAALFMYIKCSLKVKKGNVLTKNCIFFVDIAAIKVPFCSKKSLILQAKNIEKIKKTKLRT